VFDVNADGWWDDNHEHCITRRREGGAQRKGCHIEWFEWQCVGRCLGRCKRQGTSPGFWAGMVHRLLPLQGACKGAMNESLQRSYGASALAR